MQLLLELVQVSIGARECLSHNPSSKEWDELFRMAQVQTIVGILVDGLERLPAIQRPPSNILLEWIGVAQIIESQYRKHKILVAKTLECLNEEGIKVAFMKGLVCGSRYAHPERRQCGDIDFVVCEEDFQKTLDQLERIGEVDRDLIHEHHGVVYVDGINLEPHYKVHNYQNPKVDKAMKEMFMEIFPQSLVLTNIGEFAIPSFPPAFECALLVGHMVNHVYAEGLGLRQMIDFMMFLQTEHEATKAEQCKRYLKMLHMERTFRIFSCICEEYLGMPHGLLNIDYKEKERNFSVILMNDILEVGNFGGGASYLGTNKVLMPLRSYVWVFGRCCKLGYLCPAEARWWPFSKLVRYFSGKILKKR